ncbi:MAG TPA: PilZ domain-containing protein [Gaiellales bacterium]
MERTALIAEEQTPLDVGSLVSLSIGIGEPLPALVAGGDERSFALQTASRVACKVGDRAVVGWSIGGELYELRTRVTRGYDITSQLNVSRHGIITRTGDRRGVARFVLVAGGSLQLDDREVLGFTHDLSIHGVGLLLEGDAPALGTYGDLEVSDALGVLLPRAHVRVMHTSETNHEGVARVGLAFDDPTRVAGATGRLLSLLG